MLLECACLTMYEVIMTKYVWHVSFLFSFFFSKFSLFFLEGINKIISKIYIIDNITIACQTNKNKCNEPKHDTWKDDQVHANS